MSDLTEWLLGCIAEDEAMAKACDFPHWSSWVEGRDGCGGDDALFMSHHAGYAPSDERYGLGAPAQDHIARHDPAHVLAVCKAHREIVEGCSEEALQDLDESATVLAAHALMALARIYADRPGWREEWAL